MAQKTETQTVEPSDWDLAVGTTSDAGGASPIRASAAHGQEIHWQMWGPASPDQGIPESPPLLRGFENQQEAAGRLGRKSVFTGGLGAVGGRAFIQFSRLGVGHLVGVDPDRFDARSRWTQPCSFHDSGRYKATVLGRKAQQVNPGVHIETGIGYLQDVPLWRLNQADVFVVAGDNMEVLISAGELAASLGKVLIQGAVHGETWTAFVRVYDLRQPERVACPACAMSEQEWPTITTRHGCQPGSVENQQTVATRTLPNVCATAANLAVTEALKRLLSYEPPEVASVETALCLFSNLLYRTELKRNDRCRCPHRRYQTVQMDEPPSDVTLGTVQNTLASTDRADSVLIRGELPWISFAFCSVCTRRLAIRRFSRLGEQVGTCCGQPVIASPMGARDLVPRTDRAECRDAPLSQLGVSPGFALTVLCEDRATYVFVGTPPRLDVTNGTLTKETD